MPRWLKLILAGLLAFLNTVALNAFIPALNKPYVREAVLVVLFFLFRSLFKAGKYVNGGIA